MVRSLALGAALLAAGTGLGWLLASPRAGSALRSSAAPAGRTVAADAGVARDVRELRALLVGLQRDSGLQLEPVPVATALDGETAGATDVAPAPIRAERQAAGPALDPAALEGELEAVRRELRALRDAIAEGALPARLPSHELIQRSPAVQDWSRLGAFVAEEAHPSRRISDELKATVRWKNQEEVLRLFGRPDKIDAKTGTWQYRAPKDLPIPGGSVTFTFVDDYVMDVSVFRYGPK